MTNVNGKFTEVYRCRTQSRCSLSCFTRHNSTYKGQITLTRYVFRLNSKAQTDFNRKARGTHSVSPTVRYAYVTLRVTFIRYLIQALSLSSHDVTTYTVVELSAFRLQTSDFSLSAFSASIGAEVSHTCRQFTSEFASMLTDGKTTNIRMFANSNSSHMSHSEGEGEMAEIPNYNGISSMHNSWESDPDRDMLPQRHTRTLSVTLVGWLGGRRNIRHTLTRLTR